MYFIVLRTSHLIQWSQVCREHGRKWNVLLLSVNDLSFSLLQESGVNIILHCTTLLMCYSNSCELCFTYVCPSVMEATVSGAQVEES